MMKRLLRQIKHPQVRASTESALTTSAALPTSGFTFVDNSQGASAAVAELSTALGTAFEQIELEGELKEQLRLPLQRLDDEASKYCNSQLGEDEMRVEWTCSLDEAQLVAIAWECAAGAYEPASQIVHESFLFTQKHLITPSIGGSRKVATMITVTELNRKQPRNPFLPVVVVAIRGSDSKLDHMVNANSKPKNASSFINVTGLGFESSEVEAHSGFLNSAEILKPMISKRIKDLASADVNHVLFTGHSAGGAVASLLYLSYLSRRNTECTLVTFVPKDTRQNADTLPVSLFGFSCITFGSPPVIQPSIPPQPQSRGGNILVLNIINEFDVVTRADSNYILTLVNLYRSIYQMPSARGVDAPDDGMSQDTKPIAADHLNSDKESTRSFWAVPRATYSHVGERVILHMHMCEGTGSGESDDDLAGKLELRAYKVEAQAYQKLLFCRVSVHRRTEYRRRIDLIIRGYFNGAIGWEKRSEL